MNGNYRKGGGQDYHRDSPARPEIQLPKFQEQWILQGLSHEAIDYTEKLGKELAGKGLTNSQIRNFYSEVKRLQHRGLEANKSKVLMLRPKFAYASARKEIKGSKLLNEEMQKALPLAGQSERAFANFCDFFEAILAYHKVYAPK